MMSSKKQIESDDNFLNKCPLCGKRVDVETAKVVKKKENSSVLFLACPHCNGAVFLAIVDDVFGTISLGVATDFTVEDLDRFHGKKPVSSDELLDLYLFLKNKKKVIERSR